MFLKSSTCVHNVHHNVCLFNFAWIETYNPNCTKLVICNIRFLGLGELLKQCSSCTIAFALSPFNIDFIPFIRCFSHRNLCQTCSNNKNGRWWFCSFFSTLFVWNLLLLILSLNIYGLPAFLGLEIIWVIKCGWSHQNY